ncbi:hypothetical protein ABEF93_000286 [Exophiala dermatitidis]
MPNLLDTEGSLQEIKYSPDVLHADGITLFTRPQRPRRRGVRPSTHPIDTKRVNEDLKQPAVDYPHETTRTAMDLLMSQTCQRCPRCKIGNGITYDEIIRDFPSFCFDIALASSHQGLDLLLKVVASDHILYGSDFPYARHASASNFRDERESHPIDQETRARIYYRNALDLIPKLRPYLHEDHSRL